MSRRYYEDEMRYLHEAGKEFAQAHPEQARLLNVDSLADRDPYVERLFEGFAFLTARIQQRLDEAFPQYTEGLFQLLYPHFLRPFPACSVLEFKPRAGLVQQTTVVEKGTEVRSGPVGDEAVACRFSTTQAVRLQPIRLTEAGINWDGDGSSSCRLRFSLEKGVEYGKLNLEPIRLFFHAEPGTASIAHLFFTRHVRRVVIRAGDDEVVLRGQAAVTPGSFGADEGLIPYGKHSFAGFQVLQQYFAFRPQFWFVDVHGLNRLQPAKGVSSFEVEVFFDRSYPENRTLSSGNVRLFCTPIVNLFRADAEPIRTEHLTAEHRIVPSLRQPRSHRIYSVESVTGMVDKTGARKRYTPFFSFDRSGVGEGTYHTSVRLAPNERHEMYLTLSAMPAEKQLPVETISVEVLCTNRSVPRERLQEGMIDQYAPGATSLADHRNLLQPTLELQPPHQEEPDFLWKLLSHLALNHLSVADEEAFRGVLGLYEWTGSEANRRRLAGIKKVGWAAKEVIQRGAIVRGAEVTVHVEEDHFSDEGDLCLFGLILSEFLSLYATINSFVHLNLVSLPSGRSYLWQQKHGNRPVV